MANGEQDNDHAELIARMFVLLTAKLEDAAGIAVECQTKRAAGELLAGAHEITGLAEEAVTIAQATAALLGPDQ